MRKWPFLVTASDAAQGHRGMVPFQKAYLMICMSPISFGAISAHTIASAVSMIFAILAGNHGLVSISIRAFIVLLIMSVSSRSCEKKYRPYIPMQYHWQLWPLQPPFQHVCTSVVHYILWSPDPSYVAGFARNLWKTMVLPIVLYIFCSTILGGATQSLSFRQHALTGNYSPDRCFLYLFPSHVTWFLLASLVLFTWVSTAA